MTSERHDYDADARHKKKYMDPEQTDQERKVLRSQYRDLQKETIEKKDEVSNLHTDAYSKLMGKQDLLSENVLYATEAVLDVEQIHTMAQLGAKQVEHFKGILSMTSDQFIQAVKQRHSLKRNQIEGEDENETSDNNNSEDDFSQQRTRKRKRGRHSISDEIIDINQIGRLAARFFHSIPAPTFMHGPIAVEMKAPLIRNKRRKRDEVFDVIQPDVIRGEDEIRTQTDARVKSLLEILPKENYGLPFFRFILNRKSFSQTVENLFDLSFLLKDGQASVHLKNENLPIVDSRAPPNEQEDADEGLKSRQCVVKFDHIMFEKCCAKYNNQPDIPNRAPWSDKHITDTSQIMKKKKRKVKTITSYISDDNE